MGESLREEMSTEPPGTEGAETPQPAPPPPTTEELEKLRAAAAKAEEYLDLARRTKADFLNYQDRARKEREGLSAWAIEDFARALLPGLDAVRNSLSSAGSSTDPAAFVRGIELVEKEFLRIFQQRGMTPIEAMGKPFDPSFHEVVEVVDQPGVPANQVVEEVRRGWMLGGRVLRPSLVKIARAPVAG